MMYISYIVKRTQIYLQEEQDAELERRAAAAGVTKSALIRQAIDAFIEGPTDKATKLARFKAAVAQLAEHPLDLPDGKTYVEQIRAADVRRQEELERRWRERPS